ncbi:hypothetical protein M431DRAFT_527379 [Trichoderma harzianum CBS 226.95]|uniref:Uncharacterized protein n=1 Tax=Trichoderma harzianum CBS 226.95 TaxID=983964 RepID=A0A2T4ANN0_TRIHA|nr:hypothetical protein M431DRAFT_527379 [Trichoderma harzianum CBS 226.95]PTB58685.1 hypothetical protein M431DRAFT_527379 [Trichoderma harzianum CBS 226.95]
MNHNGIVQKAAHRPQRRLWLYAVGGIAAAVLRQRNVRTKQVQSTQLSTAESWKRSSGTRDERSQTLAGFSVGRGRDFQRCSEKRHRLPADAEHKYEYTGDCGNVAQGICTTYYSKIHRGRKGVERRCRERSPSAVPVRGPVLGLPVRAAVLHLVRGPLYSVVGIVPSEERDKVRVPSVAAELRASGLSPLPKNASGHVDSTAGCDEKLARAASGRGRGTNRTVAPSLRKDQSLPTDHLAIEIGSLAQVAWRASRGPGCKKWPITRARAPQQRQVRTFDRSQ